MGFLSSSTGIGDTAVVIKYRGGVWSQVLSLLGEFLSNPLSGNGSFIPSIAGNDSRRTIRTRMGSLQVIATTLPRLAKYRPVSVTATILPRMIVHLLEDPFFENAWIDEVSMPSGIGVSSA